jgi:RHS repeat-associated protein
VANQGSSLGSIISLPKGGGALQGIGEKFAPDLYTGTGNFTVPIALPPGRNGFQPQINLVYSTGNGNGPFGLGWHLSIPGISRKTSQGIPKYNDALSDVADDDADPEDTFVISGAEDLVPVPRREDDPPNRRRYRPRTEGLFADIQRHLDATNDFWEVKTKDGLISSYGSAHDRGNDLAVTPKPGSSNGTIAKVFAWKLTSTRDPFNNLIRYEYLRDAGRVPSTNPAIFEHEWDQPLLHRILYADYGDPADPNFLISVKFHYENRPDPFSDYRAGFEIRTSKRCSKISITSHAGVDLQLREYLFVYDNNTRNRVSHLKQIEIVGFDDLGTAVVELPPLEFGYTKFDPEDRKFDPVAGDLPSNPLSNNFMEVVDLHGAGLPDLLEMNGSVRYWRNLGGGRFDLPRTMGQAPPHRLGDPGVQLIDANGNGRPDLMICEGPLAGFYPLKFGPQKPSWDTHSFRSFKSPPSFDLEDPEVRLLDLNGDGITDALRSGSRFECFFNSADPRRGWRTPIARQRRSLSVFPNINFSDPRVRFADMSGDGLDDVVLIYDRNVEYWPNLGYGNWAPRVHMRAGPTLPHDYDPRRLLLGDVDGDGLADIVYVEDGEVCLWINQSGNAWSDPIVVEGTPRMNNLTSVRLVDLKGSGTAGVLWSSDATAGGKPHMFFLDLTGEVKPYLLNVMNNQMGAVTRVEYTPSSQFYLQDLPNPKTRWKTPLPFPVQVVSRVEVIDDISKGKLTTEYKYHHGYWDGAEREFHGFGMVEQLDSETFERYNNQDIDPSFSSFKQIDERHFSAPTLTKTWFHQGAVGDEYGDWSELDLSNEYWEGDPELLDHPGSINSFLTDSRNEFGNSPSGRMLTLSRRAQRDALRSLRGTILRTELYAVDGDERERHRSRPYTVTEFCYGLREVDAPDDDNVGRKRIFFPHLVVQRATQWERGDDPLTQFAFTGGYDLFGQPTQQTVVAMPRRAAKRKPIATGVNIQPDEIRILATHSRTEYATPPDQSIYLHNRVCKTKLYELKEGPRLLELDPASLSALMRQQASEAKRIRDLFAALQPTEIHLIGHTRNYYDGAAFEGLPSGQSGKYGALTRVQTLVFRDEELDAAYADPRASRRPSYLDGSAAIPNDAPPGFGNQVGYHLQSVDGVAGYYVNSQRQQFDFQRGAANPRGLVVAMRDALGNETRIETYEYQLLPTRVKDAAGMETTADYNYRVLQPARMTDPNSTSTHMIYSTIGLPLMQYVRGADAQGNETLGGSETKPEISFLYDFLHFERTKAQTGKGEPMFVHTTRRIHHASDNLSDDFIETREYSDGYGRLIQTRSQAEKRIFGATGDDAGLPAQPGADPSPAVAQTVADRVVVSGWQIYDNKGHVIEKYEPFFSRGWNFESEIDAKHGQRATMFYDARGNVIRTHNPDGSQQRVILGRPQNPLDLTLQAYDLLFADVPDSFEPTPWEIYTYDANDLAPLSYDETGSELASRAPIAHHFTPTSGVIDALGRVLCQVQQNGSDPANDWFVTRMEYDLRGNTLNIIDALNRDSFNHSYDLLNRPLRVDSIDAGLRTSVLDAESNLIEYRDSKDSLALRTYDKLNRPKELWARNDRQGAFTLRERIHYGDEGDHALARSHNTLGRAVRHYDEAGVLEMPEYDFKGNVLEKFRRTIRDDVLVNGWLTDWNATNAEDALEAVAYQTSSRYDALNRPTEDTYPQDVEGERKKLIPHYNRAGTLEKISLNDTDLVQHIAYNAKGQRVLIAYGNGVITRYAYDPHTFRLVRMRTDRASPAGYLVDLIRDDTMLFSSNGEPILDFVYTYDLAGNIARVTDLTPGSGFLNNPDAARAADQRLAQLLISGNALIRYFQYDPLYRLTHATGRESNNIPGPRYWSDDPRQGFNSGNHGTPNQDNAPNLTKGYWESYAYDPTGNMVELKHGRNGNVSWTRHFGMGGRTPQQWVQEWPAHQNDPTSWANAPGNQLTHVGDDRISFPATHLFDANGNMIQQNGERHYTWDHADRMTEYVVQPNFDSPASIEARYLYGADGMRVKKWVRKNSSGNNDESSVYIDGAFEYHRWNESGRSKENNHLHVMDNQSRIATVRIGDKHRGDGGERVQYHLGDHLGSSAVVVGGDDASASSFINREEYFPYGETSFGSFAKKRYRFTGKEREEESGLYYFGARFYAPWICRWVSCDPAGMSEGLNLYWYARDNPVRFSDFFGTQAQEAGSATASNSIVFDEATIHGTAMDMGEALRAEREAVNLGWADIGQDYRAEYKRLYSEYRDKQSLERLKLYGAMTAISGAAAVGGLLGGAAGLAVGGAIKLSPAATGLLAGGLSGAGSTAAKDLTEVQFGRQITAEEFGKEVALSVVLGGALGFLPFARETATRVAGRLRDLSSYGRMSTAVKADASKALDVLPSRHPIGFNKSWSQMTEAEQGAFQHAYSRHRAELGLPNWRLTEAEALRNQFNTVVNYIRANATSVVVRTVPVGVRGGQQAAVGERVAFYTTEIHGTKYYQYSTLDGRFISAGVVK